jgi:RecB family exonuclease
VATPIENPIINSPYREPILHWEPDTQGQPTGEQTEGRRASETWMPVARARKGVKRAAHQDELFGFDGILETRSGNDIIGEIRKLVRDWRVGGYANITPTTRRLLAYWTDESRERRLFFAQVEAVETAIYLTEVGAKLGKGWVGERLGEANAQYNAGLPRIALKMATGTGKTVVMAMLIAWHTLNKVASPQDARFTKKFLLVAPGITIRDRLRVLMPSDPNSYYAAMDLVPADLHSVLGQAQVAITNFHNLRAAVARVLDKAMMWDASRPWDATTLQGTFLDFLEASGLREEIVPGSRGELVYYNLGRFSTAIGDYERIYLTSTPQDRFTQCANWLEFQAPGYYEESDGDTGYAQPDAVVIATVHQAKGMQWPAVFLPALRKNTFPSKRSGGLNVFHVIDEALVPDADRYRGTEDDERRPFYVAATRAQKYLALSFAPNGKSMGKNPSVFFTEASRVSTALTREIDPPTIERLEPTPRRGTPDVVMSFSDLKYLFDCPYSFKLRLLYGFDSPPQKELGYGKSLHDAMAEIHKRAIDGDFVSVADAEDLVDRHLNLPFANKAAADQLRPAAIASVQRYLRENAATLRQTVYSEQPVEIHPAPGVTVTGRVDLIKRLDSHETSIVDFKSTERAQREEVTRDQLHLYALGYRELTGQNADLVEVLNLDKTGKSTREVVDPAVLSSLTDRVSRAGDALRTNNLPRVQTWCSSCASCDFAGICRKREGR